VSAANLTECFRLIQYPEEKLPSDFPIHYSMLFETDRTSIVWSAFGNLAPTCLFAGGPIIDLTSSRAIPKHVAFRMVPLKDALIDIQKILSEKRFAATTNNRRSGAFKDRMYTGLDATKILSALSSACGVEQSKEKGKGKGPATATTSVIDDGF